MSTGLSLPRHSELDWFTQAGDLWIRAFPAWSSTGMPTADTAHTSASEWITHAHSVFVAFNRTALRFLSDFNRACGVIRHWRCGCPRKLTRHAIASKPDLLTDSLFVASIVGLPPLWIRFSGGSAQ